MSITEMENKARELQELKRMQEELEAKITAVAYKITWKAVTSSRLDSTALKKELPEVAARFLKTSTVRRFTVA